MDRCTEAPVSIHFLWAPLFSQHGDRVRRYLAHRNSSRPLVVVANVLYHNVAPDVPSGCAHINLAAPNPEPCKCLRHTWNADDPGQ